MVIGIKTTQNKAQVSSTFVIFCIGSTERRKMKRKTKPAGQASRKRETKYRN